MSVERLAETVGEVVERKRVLSRAGVASLGLLGLSGLFPATAKAHYYHTHGCHLCTAPSACGPRLICAWCWQSECYSGQWYYCCEGRQEGGGDCGSSACPSYCSYYTGPWGNC